MASGSGSASDPLAVYDELVLRGEEPGLQEFCARYPAHPSLIKRIEILRVLRSDLDRLLTPGAAPASPPSIAGFRILRPLGRGGMGRVYVAEQQSPHRYCALKIISYESASARERFCREAELAARLSHPGIAQVYAGSMEDDFAYLASEYVAGFPLQALLQVGEYVAIETGSDWVVDALRTLTEQTGKPASSATAAPVAWMARLAMQVAKALAHAHEHHVVHRDIKPSNIMLAFDGTPKIIDFGVAVSTDDADDRLTAAGTFVGTRDYAAPEQLRGEPGNIGPWTDTYGLGATLFEMLTMQTPFATLTAADRVAQADQSPAHGPRHYNPRVSRRLDALVTKALHPDPTVRFADGEDMAEALAECATDSLWLSLSPPSVRRLVPTGTFASGLAVGALALSVLLAALWLGARGQLADEQQKTAVALQLSAQQIFSATLAQHRLELQHCLQKTRHADHSASLDRQDQPPRLVGTIDVLHGAVVDVHLSYTVREWTRVEQACLRDRLMNLEVPGAAPAGPRTLRFELGIHED